MMSHSGINIYILSSILNGFNLLIIQFMIPKLYISYSFQVFPFVFFIISFISFSLFFPFSCVDLYLSFIMLLLLSGLSIMLLFLLSYTGLSKYSMLGCMSLISQFVAYELMLMTVYMMLIWSYNEFTLTFYYTSFINIYYLFIISLFFYYSQLSFVTWHIHSIKLFFIISSFFILYNYAFSTMTLICILAELNSVPFDLPESESELVAGFITEYSSMYFSLMMLTEYANTMALMLLVMMMFNLPFSFIIFLLSLFILKIWFLP